MNKKSVFRPIGRLLPLFTALLIMAGCGPDPFYIQVALIEGVPETGTAGTPLALTGTVRPAFASNKDIIWSVRNAGTTGASINGNILNTNADGAVVIRAKIINGMAGGKEYTQDFIVYIKEGEPPVIPAVWYDVNFESNGGSPVAGQKVKEGGYADRPDNPVKSGYNFVNWYDNQGLIDPPYNFNAPVTGNITLYARWSSIPVYTVTFNSKGGNEIPAQTVTEGGKVNKPTDPYRTGYKFGGWYKEESLTNPWNFDGDTVTLAITLYAKWIAVYTVTFNANGGTTPASQDVEEGECAARPDDPVKAGFGFDNWYADSGLTTVYNFSTPVTGNITLYAKWLVLISGIDLNVTGPLTGEKPDTGADANGTVNYTVGLVSWSPDHNPFQGLTPYTATVTVTANPGSRFTETLTAKINGHTAVIINRTDTTVTVSHTFDKTPEKAVTNIEIASQPGNTIYTHNDKLDLTGLSVKLTYDDGSTEIFTLDRFGDIISEKPPNGSTLSHTTHDGKPVEVWIGTHHADTDKLTVNKIIIKKVTFPTAKEITYGDALSKSTLSGGDITLGSFAWADETTVPSSAGEHKYDVVFTPTDAINYDYTGVTGWNNTTRKVVQPVPITINKKDGGAVGTPSGTFSADTKTITVTAVTAPQGQTVEYALKVNNGSPSEWQDGLTFNNISSAGTYYIYARSKENTNYLAGAASVSAGITIYSVTFNANGGSAVTTQLIQSGGTVNKPADPARQSYIFGGWYKEAVFTNKWNFETDTVSGNTVIYAKWVVSQDVGFEIKPNESPPTVTNTGLVIYRSSVNGSTTITLTVSSGYTDVKWYYNDIELGKEIALVLDSSNPAYNMLGKKFVRVEAWKDGVPYITNIEFEVRP